MARNGATQMTAASEGIGCLIESKPEIRQGRPCLAGTGITVHRVAGWYKLGLSPEELAETLGDVTLAQVHAALAYYHANQAQIEADLVAEHAEAEKLERRAHAG